MADLSLPQQPTARRRLSLPKIPIAVVVAVAWILAILVVALLADTIAPYSLTRMDLKNRLSMPGNAAHWLGTDELGRDVLSRLLFSIRISLLIAFGATAISAVLGTLLGFLAAHFRGLIEQIVLMLVDFQASIPFLILALAVLAFFGSSLQLLVCLIGLYGWERVRADCPRPCHLGRGTGLCGGDQATRRDAFPDLFPAHSP
jgi:peptide/nickel transport system permease protein